MLEKTLLIVQIVFYLATGTVVILTYKNARKSLLNPVYTEYQKHVIAALAMLSEELASEFDPDSPNYWVGQHAIKEAVETINATFRQDRDRIPKAGEWKLAGYPASKEELRADRLIQSIKTDPFLPEQIRNSAVELLEGRIHALSDAESDALANYQNVLAQGKGLENIEENWHWVHNDVNKKLYEQGFGISQVGEKVDNLRIEIQQHLRSFDPT
jgi:hypothetical protein